jgi:hypothetical protein
MQEFQTEENLRDLKLSLRLNSVKSSQAISRVKRSKETNISETISVPTIIHYMSRTLTMAAKMFPKMSVSSDHFNAADGPRASNCDQNFSTPRCKPGKQGTGSMPRESLSVTS